MTDVLEAGTLTVNGVAEPLAPTVGALLASRDIAPDGRGVAVAVNGAVVRRADWATTPLNAGDTVEIVSGLSPGERIVAAGSFLLDWHSRMGLTGSR